MPKFATVRFGELEYRERDVIWLPEGLIGLPQLRRWLILDLGDDLPMRWLQSLDRGDFGVPVTPPEFFSEDYRIDVPGRVTALLGTAAREDLVTLIITTVHDGGNRLTGNTMAPLLIDTESRRGVQLNLDDERFSLRQEIDYFKFGLAVGAESSDNGAPTVDDAAGDVDRGADPVAVELRI